MGVKEKHCCLYKVSLQFAEKGRKPQRKLHRAQKGLSQQEASRAHQMLTLIIPWENAS